jgi:CRISPR-associated protein Cas1
MKRNLFIFSSGELKREENTLCFISNGHKKFIPASNVSSIYIFGELSFNKRLLEFLSTNEITLHIFNYYGYYMGSFYPRTHYNSGYMAIKQCEHYIDATKRLILARKFVEGAILNMFKNLTYYKNRGVELTSYIDSIKETLKEVKRTKSIEELMAVEGKAKETYYLSFNVILKNDEFKYERRERRPPKSPLDALISFGNSLLYVTVLGEIYKTHLDPRIGFLHASNFRKFSLNLDVAEIFKPVIVDRLIFTLINKGMMDSSSFDKELGGIYLCEKGRRTFIEKYDEKLNQTISLQRRKVSYQRLIRLELYKLERHLIGENEYKPFVSQW